MEYQDVKIGDIYLFVPGNKDRVNDIDFVRVIEQQEFIADKYAYFTIYNRKGFSSCFAVSLFDNINDAISFVRKIAQGGRDYDVEYEIKATKKVIDKFKNKDELEGRLRSIKKETLDDALNIHNNGTGLYEQKRDKQHYGKIKKNYYARLMTISTGRRQSNDQELCGT